MSALAMLLILATFIPKIFHVCYFRKESLAPFILF